MLHCVRVFTWYRAVSPGSVLQYFNPKTVSSAVLSSPSSNKTLYVSKLHTTSQYFDTADDSDKPQVKNTKRNLSKKIQNTTKTRPKDANNLIKEVSKELHPRSDQFRERNEMRDVILDYLKEMKSKTESRRNTEEEGYSVHGTEQTPTEEAHGQPKTPQRESRERATSRMFLDRLKRTPRMRDGCGSMAVDKEVVDKYVDMLLNEKVERIGIFDKTDKVASEKKITTSEVGYKTAIDWWDEWSTEVQKDEKATYPRNHYQEMLEWTQEGRFPTFPIDNEVGMEKESSIPFHRHIFLHELIEEGFPKSGPIREFMEAVVLGLSKNPYLTVEEKEEHINWFREYFNEKFELLKALGTIKDDKMIEEAVKAD